MSHPIPTMEYQENPQTTYETCCKWHEKNAGHNAYCENHESEYDKYTTREYFESIENEAEPVW